jgi:hypothetical protein
VPPPDDLASRIRNLERQIAELTRRTAPSGLGESEPTTDAEDVVTGDGGDLP